MSQLIAAATEAVRQGNRLKAVEILREVLRSNPNDIEGWLLLATLVDQPERKRQCLQRVLTLDPTHRVARQEMLNLDRAAMGAPRAEPVQPAATPAFAQGTPVSAASQAVPEPKPQPGSKPRPEKPLVFKYSIVTRFAAYLFTALFACGLLLALQDPTAVLVPCSLFVIMLPVLWIVSAQVEVSEKGIRTSRMFGLAGSQVGWDEIASLKSNSMRSNLELVTKKGHLVKVTSQVSGYPVIVERLREKRPDLFGAVPSPEVAGSSYAASVQALAGPAALTSDFSGTKTFEKSFFRQYAMLLVGLPMFFFAVAAAFTEPQYRVGAILAALFCVVLCLLPFFQVSGLKVEPNKLTIQTFFEEKELNAGEVKEITMKSIRGRYGRVTNIVNISLVEGKNYPLGGFSAGDEIIYGFLMNWWNTYRK